jgi:MarR family transcriptional regulator, lower aerobic nicotinate degradation pathway regulator
MVRKQTTSGPKMPKTFTSGGVPVRRSAIALARRFFQICTSAYAEASAEVGLTPLQGGILAYLTKQTTNHDIDQNGLAARLGIDRASTSALIDELESMGLVERRVSHIDRRARLLRLTERGEKVRSQLHPRSMACQARVFATLSSHERELLLDLLTRVVESNSDLARPGSGRRKRGFRHSTSGKSQTSTFNTI